jgi:hypothetical protein
MGKVSCLGLVGHGRGIRKYVDVVIFVSQWLCTVSDFFIVEAAGYVVRSLDTQHVSNRDLYIGTELHFREISLSAKLMGKCSPILTDSSRPRTYGSCMLCGLRKF